MSTCQTSKSSREIADRTVRSKQYFCACGKDVVTGDEEAAPRGGAAAGIRVT